MTSGLGQENTSGRADWAGPAALGFAGFAFFLAWILWDPEGRPKKNAGKRRISARRRARGRPSGHPVDEDLTVRLPGGPVDVTVERGLVTVSGRPYGTVYDLGTSFRSIPASGPVRSFGTLAGAVKHVLRQVPA